MSKKRCYLAVLAGLTAIPLFAAENLAPQELNRYGRSNVVVKEDGFLYQAVPGKWTCVTWKAPLKKGYYGYSLEYRGVGAVPPQTVLKTAVKPEVQPEQYRRGWDVAEFSETWKRISSIFYMPADGTARMDAYVECKAPASVMVRTIKLFPLPEKELASVKVETAADLVPQWKLLWKFRNSSSRLELLPAEDHIEGGYAVKLTPEAYRTAVLKYSYNNKPDQWGFSHPLQAAYARVTGRDGDGKPFDCGFTGSYYGWEVCRSHHLDSDPETWQEIQFRESCSNRTTRTPVRRWSATSALNTRRGSSFPGERVTERGRWKRRRNRPTPPTTVEIRNG